jgi:hypothetical protein
VVVIAAGVLLAAVALAAVFRTVGTARAALWLAGVRPEPPADATPFVVLLPAFREQSLVAETLAHFRSLDYPRDRFRVLVVTSERERIEREAQQASLEPYLDLLWSAKGGPPTAALLTGHLPGATVADLLAGSAQLSEDEFKARARKAFAETGTTGQLVTEIAGSDQTVRCLEAPASWLRKAGQLRYAIDHLEDALGDWPQLAECRYVAVYDFDARTEPTALTAAAHAAASRAPILQQPGLTVPRLRVQPTLSSRLFTMLDAQLHARYGLRVELNNILIDRIIGALPATLAALLRSSVHTVGNGLFLDRVELPRLGGIPEVVDDLAIGWRAAAQGTPIAPVHSLVFYDAYTSLRQSIQSRKFICTGFLRATRDIKAAPARLQGVLPGQLIRIHARLVQWAFGPYLRLALLAVLAVITPTWTVAVVVLTYLCYVTDMLTVHAVWRRWQPIPAPRWLVAVALVVGPVALVWFGAGPRRVLLGRLIGKGSAPTGKTER